MIDVRYSQISKLLSILCRILSPFRMMTKRIIYEVKESEENEEMEKKEENGEKEKEEEDDEEEGNEEKEVGQRDK